MINYLNRLISSYSFQKREVRGIKYHYKYKGKFIFFDPIQMLLDCKYRSSESNIPIIRHPFSASQVYKALPFSNFSQKPSIVCEVKRNEGILIVSRFTFKQENRSISYYEFGMEGEIFGRLYRLYDNGISISNYALKISSAIGGSLPPLEDRIIWKSDSGDEIFIENFSQTQIWIWNQPIDKIIL